MNLFAAQARVALSRPLTPRLFALTLVSIYSLFSKNSNLIKRRQLPSSRFDLIDMPQAVRHLITCSSFVYFTSVVRFSSVAYAFGEVANFVVVSVSVLNSVGSAPLSRVFASTNTDAFQLVRRRHFALFDFN